MINLLPTQALAGVKREYWVRVFSLWALTLAVAFLVSGLLLLPTYVLLSSQVDAYEASATEVENEVNNYKDASASLIAANERAIGLIKEAELESFSEITAFFSQFESSEINISSLELAREGTALGIVIVGGTAQDRQSLAALRDDLLETQLVTQVDLPISNLARDENIPFSLAVTIAPANAEQL